MNITREQLKLYAVTDRSWLGSETLYEQVEKALKGGATLVQLREKTLDEAAFEKEGQELLELCHHYNVPLIINVFFVLSFTKSPAKLLDEHDR